MNDYIQESPLYSIAVIILLYLPICCAWYYLQFWAPTEGLRVYHPKIEEIILLSTSKQQNIVLTKKGKIKCSNIFHYQDDSINFLKFFHYQLTNQDFSIQSQICINTITKHENATGNAHYHTQRLSEVIDSAKVGIHPDVYIPQCPSEVRLSKGRKEEYTVTIHPDTDIITSLFPSFSNDLLSYPPPTG